MKVNSKLLWILVFGFILSTSVINQSFWLDESINVAAVRDKTWSDLLTNYALGDFHPPLYHLVMKPWISLVGDSEIMARMPSVIFGLVSVFFLYLITQEVLPKKKLVLGRWQFQGALLAPLLLATSGLHIYYSGEARMYALAQMWTSISIFWLISAYKRNLLTKWWQEPTRAPHLNLITVAYILSSAAMLLSDYVPWMLLPLLIIVAPILTVLALLITTPWWPYFYQQLSIGLNTASEFPEWGRVVGGFSLKNIALIPIKFMIGRVSVDNNLHYVVLLIIPLALFFGLIAWSLWQLKKSKYSYWLIIGWFLVPLAVGILLSLKISLLSYFRFLFVLPAMYLLFVIAIFKLPSRWRGAIFLTLLSINLLTSGAYIFNSSFHREDWRGFASWIDQFEADQAITVIPSMGQADPYEFYQQRVPITDTIDFETLPQYIFLLRYVQIIFDPQDLQRQQIEGLGYELVSIKYFRGVEVWVYENANQAFATRMPTNPQEKWSLRSFPLSPNSESDEKRST